MAVVAACSRISSGTRRQCLSQLIKILKKILFMRAYKLMVNILQIVNFSKYMTWPEIILLLLSKNNLNIVFIIVLVLFF